MATIGTFFICAGCGQHVTGRETGQFEVEGQHYLLCDRCAVEAQTRLKPMLKCQQHEEFIK